jgi:hypothetical protein
MESGTEKRWNDGPFTGSHIGTERWGWTHSFLTCLGRVDSERAVRGETWSRCHGGRPGW